jgi:predicted TIM-barrel fold metal-dependent hydrolase
VVGDDVQRYVVISADTHGGAKLLDYREYLPRRWHEEFDRWASTFTDPWGHLQADDTRGDWESDRRIRDLEADGIVAEVMFPNTVPPFYPTFGLFTPQPRTRPEYERRFAGIQAHNRWVADFCAEAPGRRASFVQVFLNDVDDAVTEIRRGKAAGLPAVLLPGAPPNHPVEPLHDPRYEPIWSVCEELEMPVNQHIGTGGPDVAGDRPADGAIMGYELAFFGHRSLWHLIFGGVFDRHPNLKFVMTEEGLGWVEPELVKLDAWVRLLARAGSAGNLLGDAVGRLSLTPSEYARRNCYIGASFCSIDEIKTRGAIGVDHIMWGADYPHVEGTTPYSREALRATFADVDGDDCRKIFATNAADVYGFDMSFLHGVARNVGPTVQETHTPLERYPERSTLEDHLGPLPARS